MGIEMRVRTVEILLEQIAEEPNAVLQALHPAERDSVLASLRRFTEKADTVDSETGILDLSNGIYDLVAGIPELRRMLLLETTKGSVQRKVSSSAHEASSARSQHAQSQAAQIRNRVVECRKKLEEALQQEQGSQDCKGQ